jgi:hypothetical protein
MKETLVIWLGIILLIVTLLFPPYGYTKIKTDFSHIMKPGEHYDLDLDENHTSHEVVPFTYVRHQFILSEPNRSEPRLEKGDAEFANLVPNTHAYSEAEDMRIAWHIVAVQAAAIILLTGGIVFTLRVRQKSRKT